MTDGLFKKLSPEQQAAALAFDGNPDFGPPMTDLTQAIALMRRVCAAEGPWEAEDFVRSDDLAKGLQPGPVDKAEATILNAAASGELFPLADHKLAVALMVEKAENLTREIVSLEAMCDHDCDNEDCVRCFHYPEILEQKKAARSALADTDALAEVQALRAELAATQAKLARLETLPPDFGHDGLRWKIVAAMLRNIDAAHPQTDRTAALYHAFRAGLRAVFEGDKP